MSKRILEEQSTYLMRYLISEEQIRDKVLSDIRNRDKFKTCDIREDGTITLGRTKSQFLNQLLACQEKIPFEAFALRVWDALVAMSTGENSITLEENLSTEIAKAAQKDGNYDYIIHRLVDCYNFICNNKPGSKKTPAGAGGEASPFSQTANIPFKLTINGIPQKTEIVRDCVGDALINVNYGITGVTLHKRKL